MSATNVSNDPYILKQNSDRLSAYFRGRRFGKITSMIEQIHAQRGACRIIDIGGREEYWHPALATLRRCNARVTVVNLEKTQPDPGPLFDFHHGDACDLGEYASESFDLAHQNSLIEHVGNWENMRRCAAETRRVAKAYYVQTPYFWFPLEPHFRMPFFHWLPEQVRARLVTRFKLGYFNRAQTLDQAMMNVQSCAILDGTQLKALFPDGVLSCERVIGIPKSLIVTRM